MDPTTETVDTTIQTQPETQPAIETPVASPPPAVEPRNVLQIPSDAMKRIKAEERKKGERAARQALDAEARELGYRDHASLVEGAKRARQPKPAPAQPKGEQPSATTSDGSGAPRHSDKHVSKLERDNARLVEEKRRLNQARNREEKARRAAQRQLDAVQAEGELRLVAFKCGIQDVDYAIHLLKQKVRGRSIEELSTFDESKFFGEELRRSHPLLFQAVERPADTAPADGEAHPAAKLPTNGGAGTGTESNVMKMSREQYLAHIAKLGLVDPSAGLPS
jgi:hypothetical protein